MARDDDWDGVREHNAKLGEIRAAVEAERERCAQIAESFPTRLLSMWERPGGPPGNGWVEVNGQAYIAQAIRASVPTAQRGSE